MLVIFMLAMELASDEVVLAAGLRSHLNELRLVCVVTRTALRRQLVYPTHGSQVYTDKKGHVTPFLVVEAAK